MVVTYGEGAMLCQQARHGAAARSPVQPQHQRAALRVALSLCKPADTVIRRPQWFRSQISDYPKKPGVGISALVNKAMMDS